MHFGPTDQMQMSSTNSLKRQYDRSGSLRSVGKHILDWRSSCTEGSVAEDVMCLPYKAVDVRRETNKNKSLITYNYSCRCIVYRACKVTWFCGARCCESQPFFFCCSHFQTAESEELPGLPWRLDFNPRTRTTLTEKPGGIPTESPCPLFYPQNTRSRPYVSNTMRLFVRCIFLLFVMWVYTVCVSGMYSAVLSHCVMCENYNTDRPMWIHHSPCIHTIPIPMRIVMGIPPIKIPPYPLQPRGMMMLMLNAQLHLRQDVRAHRTRCWKRRECDRRLQRRTSGIPAASACTHTHTHTHHTYWSHHARLENCEYSNINCVWLSLNFISLSSIQ